MTPDSFLGRSIEELPSPAVIVDLERVRANIERMAAQMRAFGVALRPHWKTSKSAEIARMQLSAGAVGLTVATARELGALVDAGVDDVFWAYPPVGRDRVEAALEAARCARLIVSGDSVEALSPLAIAAAETGLTIDFRLEVDTGLGRTGVDPDRAVERLESLDALPGLRFEGIYTHEGQVQGVGADPVRRQTAGEAAGSLLTEVADEIRRVGFGVASVSVGSTAGALSAPSVAGVTEARPGTYVYGDENQLAIGTARAEETAMTVLSRVISMERSGTVLVDAGIKALSSDGSMHGDGRIGTVTSESGGVVRAGHEEHGFVAGARGLRVGDPIRIRPNHACGLTNMHSRVFAVEDGIVMAVWPVLARH